MDNSSQYIGKVFFASSGTKGSLFYVTGNTTISLTTITINFDQNILYINDRWDTKWLNSDNIKKIKEEEEGQKYFIKKLFKTKIRKVIRDIDNI